jgi:Glycosyl hydrolase family 36 C-terminal domain/Phage integrase SAM-like domain
MQTVRKTQRKGSRSTQNIKRFKQTEQKMTLFEMFERFMAFKQTEGLAKPTIQGYYEHFHYLNDFLGGDVPNEEVTVELFRTYIGYMLNDQGLKPTTVNVRIRTNELDLTKLSKEEKEVLIQQVSSYKEIRRLIQFGDFYRLKSPFDGNETAWLFSNKDKTEAMVFYFRVLAEPAAPFTFLKLSGIDVTKQYQVIGADNIYGGDELVYSGLSIPIELKGDFQSHTLHLKVV